MTAEEALSTLDKIKTDMHKQFPKNVGRLEQLDHHIATAAMAVEHLFDEQVRTEHARAERIRAAENEEN